MMGIYEICNLHDGKATAYVGSSVNIEQRWQGHRWQLDGGKHYNIHLQNAWDKYGEAAFEWDVIEEVEDEARLLEREQYWLDRFLESPATCYNVAITAGPGGSLSEEHKRNIGKAMKGKSPWNKGKTDVYSEEHKRMLREVNLGNQNSLGRKMTDENKRKLKAASVKPYPAFVHQETGEIIPAGSNLCGLCRTQGLSQAHMWRVMRGQCKQHKGWELL